MSLRETVRKKSSAGRLWEVINESLPLESIFTVEEFSVIRQCVVSTDVEAQSQFGENVMPRRIYV